MAGKQKIGIIGSGLIGRSWAMLFASVGYQVAIYDVEPKQLENALQDIKTQLKELEKTGMLRGTLTSEEQYQLIKTCTKLEDCVKGTKYLQECIPERLEMKKTMFNTLDKMVDEKTILGSSTSCILPSRFTEDLKHRHKCIVAHPVNPPYYVPLVELVPAPWTDPQVVADTKALMSEIGQAPVVLRKEIDGFILNRLQYAIITEAWRLYKEDVASVEDIDKVMSQGLGMRYAFLGPLETAHLNAEGMVSYVERYGSTIHNVASSFGPVPHLDEQPTLQKVYDELCEKIPVKKLPEHRLQRDTCLTGLAKLKKELSKK